MFDIEALGLCPRRVGENSIIILLETQLIGAEVVRTGGQRRCYSALLVAQWNSTMTQRQVGNMFDE